MSLTQTASDKPTVLIVDDERFNLSALHALLRDDCRVMVATDGELGLTAARANLPDLILLDVTMPGISGHDVCRALKEDPPRRASPSSSSPRSSMPTTRHTASISEPQTTSPSPSTRLSSKRAFGRSCASRLRQI